MKYKIEIKKTLSTVEEIEANSKEEAIDKIQNKYYNQEIVLEPDSFNGVEFTEYKNKSHLISDNDKNYITFILGYDLLNKTFANSGESECDLVYEKAKAYTEEFLSSEYNVLTKNLYDCLVDFVQSKELKETKDIKYYDPEERFEINIKEALKFNDFHYRGIKTQYLEDTNTLIFSLDKPVLRDEDDLETIVYRNQRIDNIRDYIDQQFKNVSNNWKSKIIDSIDVYTPERFKEEFEKYNSNPEDWFGTIIKYPGVYAEIDETNEYKDGEITTDIYFYKTLEDLIDNNYIEGSGCDIYCDNFVENLNGYVSNEFSEEEESEDER